MTRRDDVRGEIRQFLPTRRAKISPERAGLPVYGGNRRVPGLRREEVALLAGISIEYYTRLERGNARGVSEEVLEALARALQLDEVAEAGRDPHDRALTDLVGELSVRSQEFRYDVLELPADPGQSIVAYTADPDT